MPGVDLNLDLPTGSDTMADVVSKTATALAAIEADLAADVVSSEIDINAALSFAGNSALDVGSLHLVAGNPPSAVGSLYYSSDGEFYLITAAGTVQVTASGSLDLAGTGGIVGDYGLGPESVAYDNASGEYRFKEDTSIWADIVADDLVLMGSAGSVRFSVDAAITSARQINVKDLPAAGVSALVYDASDSSLKRSDVTRITNDLKATILDISGNLRHGERTYVQGFGVTLGHDSSGETSVGAGVTALVNITAPLLAGVSRVKSISLLYDNNTNPSLTYVTKAGTTLTEVGPVLGVTVSDASVGGTMTRRTITIDTPTTIGALTRAFVKVQNNNGAAALVCHEIAITYDAVA